MDAEEKFGNEALALRRFADTAGVFRRSERRKLEAALDRFGRKFPQLFMSIYTGAGGGVAHLRQFGFWLLNHAEFDDLPDGCTNRSGIMLVIDPSAKAATMCFGYTLDPYLNQDDTFDCLARAHAWWLEGRYADGAIRVIHRIEEILKRRSLQATRDPQRFARKVRKLNHKEVIE